MNTYPYIRDLMNASEEMAIILSSVRIPPSGSKHLYFDGCPIAIWSPSTKITLVSTGYGARGAYKEELDRIRLVAFPEVWP